MDNIEAKLKKVDAQIAELSDLKAKLETVESDLQREMSKQIEQLQSEVYQAKRQLEAIDASNSLPPADAKREAQAVLDNLEQSYRRTLTYLTKPR